MERKLEKKNKSAALMQLGGTLTGGMAKSTKAATAVNAILSGIFGDDDDDDGMPPIPQPQRQYEPVTPIDCSQCFAACCRYAGCKNLDTQTNRCRIYDQRPVACRVDNLFERYKDRMSEDEYTAMVHKHCDVIRNFYLKRNAKLGDTQTAITGVIGIGTVLLFLSLPIMGAIALVKYIRKK